MASTVSYANIAANGTVAKPESPVLEPEAAAAPEAPTSANEPLETDTPVESTEPSVTDESGAEPAKVEKKVLAPAPVPSKSAWGAAPVAASASVDEHKWPTPDKVAELQSQTAVAKPAASRFIKPNKWVPIPAKVVLPSPKSSQYQNGASSAKNKRKNKTARKKPAADDKKDDKPRDDGEVSQFAEGDDAELEASTDANGDSQHAYEAYNRQRATAGQNQKNYKRYPTGASNGKSAAGQHPQPRQGFYPQFVPGQYQNYNGARSFKPEGFRGNSANGAYSNGTHPMGAYSQVPHHPQAVMSQGLPYGTPMPVYIPPPISPKQDPLHALTQQIDYYFSLDNLIRDVFLRRNMGTEGWVDLDLILNFKRVKIIVNGILNSIEEADQTQKSLLLDAAILRAVQLCVNLEIGYLNGKDDKTATATEVQLRVKSNFEQWLLSDM